MNIVEAEKKDLDALADLFNNYRMFYEQEGDLAAARVFINDRLERSDSVLLIAKDDAGNALGFTQSYPTFCSIEMKPRWILHDLFVAKTARRKGVAQALMQENERLGQARGIYSLCLDTAKNNYPGQGLYEKLGYTKDNVFIAYSKIIE